MKKLWRFLAIVFLIGLLIPQSFEMPVENASKADFNKDSFWYYPWGKSGTHKGVDIFAKAGTSLHSATPGLVLYTGNLSLGGKVVLVLGPKWRFHYYAHLDEISTSSFRFVNTKTQIGTVGNTGNAAGKPAHLHYSILTLVPYVWRIDTAPQGWLKMFYLNPIDFLLK
ncbi:MAG: M23 family metallopeptidase [Salibacteraceae bacterium]|jgi:peptidoglycan LD-endopeptidase LytH|nr:M23 family metallopeptidase [Salibacteraceae bacterium]MDP4844865.1 M23 family metallopeptidase [Salibacteraceae bacterium]MDP4935158.1 M23 family metallopeptidase [Salibacteraceae bacterium]MDP4964699.1 M23 family metallopeptidase [Salibacteraceae bacterium]